MGFGGTEGIVEKANLYAGFRTLLEGLYELLADGVVVDDETLEVNMFCGMANAVKHLGVGLVSTDERYKSIAVEQRMFGVEVVDDGVDSGDTRALIGDLLAWLFKVPGEVGGQIWDIIFCAVVR